MAIARKRLTLEEFLELPEQKPALEYVDGVVTRKVSPQARHSVVQAEIVEFVNRLARPARLARAFPELRVAFAGNAPVPDVSVYRWDRIPRDERGKIENRFWEPPDIAFEVVSPGQRVNALVQHCQRFVRDGVQIVLLVEPGAEWIRDFRAGAESGLLRGEDLIDLTSVVAGLSFTAQEIFDSLYER